MSETAIIPAMAQLALALSFAVLSLYVLGKLLRLAIAWLRWCATRATGNPVVNIVAFAVAAHLYPNPLTYIFYNTWYLVTSLVTYLPSLLQVNLATLGSSCARVPLEACLGVAGSTLWSSWNIFVSNIFNRINFYSFPLIDAILLTALWLTLATILDWAFVGRQLGASLRRAGERLAAGYLTLSHATRSNSLFFLVLAIGGYLSLTSIIAIPSLQEEPQSSERINPEQVQSSLVKVALKNDEFDKRFSLDPSTMQGLEKNRAFIELRSAVPPPPEQVWIRDWGNAQLGRIADLEARWASLHDDFRRAQMNTIDIATETFDLSNRGRKGVRETQQHVLNIELWYRKWWAQRAAQLVQCKSAVERFAARSNVQFDSLLAFTRADPGARASAFTPDFGNELSKQLDQADAEAVQACAGRPESFDVPAREDFGRYLGVFGLAARWLLKTESLSLVLITGLLGFGLMGAACSTVIRKLKTRNPGEPLVPNLAGVAIRGVSAAILVFLAVYGGLAVYTGGSASPNPYVVLFTCLAAAVFSEDAWAWGAQRFKAGLARLPSKKRRARPPRS